VLSFTNAVMNIMNIGETFQFVSHLTAFADLLRGWFTNTRCGVTFMLNSAYEIFSINVESKFLESLFFQILLLSIFFSEDDWPGQEDGCLCSHLSCQQLTQPTSLIFHLTQPVLSNQPCPSLHEVKKYFGTTLLVGAGSSHSLHRR